MKKQSKWGGKREGAGKKPQGKKSYLVSLTEKNAERAQPIFFTQPCFPGWLG